MRRLVWFAVGAGVGVVVILKAREYARRATPQALQEKMAARGQGWADDVARFGRTLSEAMTAREAELRDALGLADDDARATSR